MRMHPDICLVIADLLQLAQSWLFTLEQESYTISLNFTDLPLKTRLLHIPKRIDIITAVYHRLLHDNT